MAGFDPQFGILLHQLRKDDIGRAMDFLPKDIRHKNYDDLGMRVYFWTKERAEESVRRKNIQVNGISYNIYPLVTCLTVIGIGRSARSMNIRESLETIHQPIIENYQVNESVDHRIVLDVPEVLANFTLPDISVPENPNKKFPVVFYCRCCGGDHKQYQCMGSPRTTTVCDDGDISSRPSNQNNASARRTNTGGPVPTTSRTPTAAERSTEELHKTKKGTGPMQRRMPSSPKTTAVREGGGSLSRPLNRKNTSARRTNTEGPVPSTSRTPTTAERSRQELYKTKRATGLTQIRKPTVQSRLQNRHTTKNKRRSRKGEYPCNIVVEVISGTSGILGAEDMIQFLKQVYGKKERTVIQIVSDFTSDTPALISQLESIVQQLQKIWPK